MHDVTLRLMSKLLDRRLQIDLRGGLHYEAYNGQPEGSANTLAYVTDSRAQSIADFEKQIEPCKTVKLDPPPNGTIGGYGSMPTFTPCPASGYRDGRLRPLPQRRHLPRHRHRRRHLLLKLGGVHAPSSWAATSVRQLRAPARLHRRRRRRHLRAVRPARRRSRRHWRAPRQYGTIQPDGSVKLMSQDIGGFQATTTTLNYWPTSATRGTSASSPA